MGSVLKDTTPCPQVCACADETKRSKQVTLIFLNQHYEINFQNHRKGNRSINRFICLRISRTYALRFVRGHQSHVRVVLVLHYRVRIHHVPMLCIRFIVLPRVIQKVMERKRYYKVRYAGRLIKVFPAHSKWEAIDRVYHENITQYPWIDRSKFTAVLNR